MCILLTSIAAVTLFMANTRRTKAAADERLMKGLFGRALFQVAIPRPLPPAAAPGVPQPRQDHRAGPPEVRQMVFARPKRWQALSTQISILPRTSLRRRDNILGISPARG